MKPINRPDEDIEDCRLYVPHPEEWIAALKTGWEKWYCYSKNPDEDFFHLILKGEIYLQSGNEKLCLRCAMRQGIITTERLNWQNGEKKHRRT